MAKTSKNSISTSKPRSSLECRFCSKKFRWRCQLEFHLRVHTGEQPFLCEICNQRFTLKWNLNRHLSTVHPNENKVPITDSHGKVDSSKNSEISNQAGASGILKRGKIAKNTKRLDNKSKQKFQCDVCLKKFNLISELRIHRRIHAVSEKSHICPVCNCGFTRRYGLKLHSFIHTGEMPFKCDTCDLGFKEIAKLNQHKRILRHKGENVVKHSVHKIKKASNVTKSKSTTDINSFPCGICSRKLGSRIKLQIHMRKHKGENTLRPYECRVCKSRFRRRDTLKIHLYTHTGVKPFKCDICDFRFTTHGYMTFHKKQVHIGENPTILKMVTKSKSFKCDKKCKKIFTENSKLSSHKKNAHSTLSSTVPVPVRKRKPALKTTADKNVKPVLDNRDEPSTSQTSKVTEICLQSLNLSPVVRAKQWSSFLKVFEAKVAKKT